MVDEGHWGTLHFDLKSAPQSTATRAQHALMADNMLYLYSGWAQVLEPSVYSFPSGKVCGHWVLTLILNRNHKIKTPLLSQRLIQTADFRRSIGLHSKYVGQVDASMTGSLPIAFPPI